MFGSFFNSVKVLQETPKSWKMGTIYAGFLASQAFGVWEQSYSNFRACPAVLGPYHEGSYHFGSKMRARDFLETHLGQRSTAQKLSLYQVP